MIAEKDREGALFTLKQLLTGGEPPLKILTMITRQVRLLAQANEMLERVAFPAVDRSVAIPPMAEASSASSTPMLKAPWAAPCWSSRQRGRTGTLAGSPIQVGEKGFQA